MTHLINPTCTLRKWWCYILAKHLCSGQDQDPMALHLIIYLSPDFAEHKKYIKICIALAEQLLPYGKTEEFSVQKHVSSTKWLKCVIPAQRTFDSRFR